MARLKYNSTGTLSSIKRALFVSSINRQYDTCPPFGFLDLLQFKIQGVTPYYVHSIKKHKDCDEWCCSRIELVGHHASRENHANNKYYKYGQLMINVRAISIFIVAGGRLAAMRYCRTSNGYGRVNTNRVLFRLYSTSEYYWMRF
jgi:hypothetical protein